MKLRIMFAAATMAAVCYASLPQEKASVDNGVKWLLATQGPDGGWGQDGGATSHARKGVNLETNQNDVANTAVAVMAIRRAGSYPAHVRRGVEFILSHVEKSKDEGLAITAVEGTQIQRKLGPFIDTFLTSMLFSEIDGQMNDVQLNRRVRAALEKCVRKIESAQLQDGSWNISGGWAPILGTSMASRSLFQAKAKGVKVRDTTLARVDTYTTKNAAKVAESRVVGGRPMAASDAGAGVALYDRAQMLEQLSRTEADRQRNKKEIKAIENEVAQPALIEGFGSMGGEEFFSYLNISESMRRTGGDAWKKWNTDIKAKLVKLQNNDGTWAGHHCITGRVAVTSAAVLTLTADR